MLAKACTFNKPETLKRKETNFTAIQKEQLNIIENKKTQNLREDKCIEMI